MALACLKVYFSFAPEWPGPSVRRPLLSEDQGEPVALAADDLRQADKLFIDGTWREPSISELADVLNPATEEVFAHAPVGAAADCDAAVKAARQAIDEGPWGSMARKERSARLQAFHAHLEARTDEIAELAVKEAGATQAMALAGHVVGPLKYLAFCAEQAARDWTKSQPVTVTPAPNGSKILGASVSLREPVGVVAAITAFNFPFLLNLQKVGPALAMGNTVILKPSPFTPLEALILGEAAEAADLPPGVLNIVTGGPDVGALLTTDPRINLVSFTGSDAVGAKILEQAAPSLKRVLLELGGKSALIVRQDADLEAATDAGVFSNINQAGQGCILWTRHLVHNAVRDAYVERLREKLSAVRVGDPADPSTTMGPLIRESQRSRVEGYVAKGLEEGAKLVLGGQRPAHLQRGYFYEPTVFDDVDNHSTIAQQEIFGPVTSVIGFDDDDQAVRLANDSVYGLSGHIFSRDVGAAYEMAARLKTGQVWLNGGNGTTNPWDPFGGTKRSGIGKEGGEEGFFDFTDLKVVRFRGG
jgi:aldehyde dehydrogenase (NAD+)